MFQSSNLVFCRVLKGLLLAACEDVEKKKKSLKTKPTSYSMLILPIPWVKFLQSKVFLTVI